MNNQEPRARNQESLFAATAEAAFAAASADDVVLSFTDQSGGTTRFANNQVTQNIDTRRAQLAVTCAFGRRHGTATTTDTSAAGIRRAVERAEAIARVAPEDPEYLPPVQPRAYPIFPTHRPETANAGAERRAELARLAAGRCAQAGMQAAGVAATYTTAHGLAASNGLRAFEQRSEAEFSITATAADSTGWARNRYRSIDDLDVTALVDVAIERARSSATPREIPAGPVTVILEPAAVLGIIRPLTWALDAKGYHAGTTALAGKLDQAIVSPRLTLANRPDHPALLASGFGRDGLANDWHTWIEDGVLRRIDYDRFTAREHGVDPSYGIDAGELTAANPEAETVADLIAATPRGVLVTNFWYIRHVNRRDLTLTGMTRDGTFLIEDGRVAGGLVNFRFHESPLTALNRVTGATPPMDAMTTTGGKMLLPALRLADFHFSSVTRF